ncbi:MAG: helix-turn-helix domain-containing protein [Proteobacteria bacterium]|nr:helix-turn-helix domain-containing protein [Pseudomonadota bacterium]MBU1610238.1 helix-turn-helix domain-containing protein [Pseudomonadota bacterium]
MDFKEMGQLLRQQREKLGLSIADISENTRISRSILMIFENGNTEELPHPVYAKGFIRNYAKALGLDPMECSRVLEREMRYGEDEGQGTVRKNVGNETHEPSIIVPTKSSWPAVLGVLALIILLGFLIWKLSISQGGNEIAPLSEDTVGQVIEQAAMDPSLSQEGLAQAAEELIEDVAEPVPEMTQEEITEGSPASEAGLAVQASATGMTSPQEVVDSAGDVTGTEHTLIISVTGDTECWVGVWRPDIEEIARNFTVFPGKSVTYKFDGQRILRFGRIESVQLSLDGNIRSVKGAGVVNLTLP